MRPCSPAMRPAAARTASRSVTSSAIAWLPGCSATKPSSMAALRAETTTRAPAACSRVAVARPMPLDAPTSQAVRPGQSLRRGLSAMVCRSGLVERQRDVAQVDAELAHRGPVQHHMVVHQEHPVVELHLVDLAVDRQAQGVVPVQRVAGRRADGGADDVAGGAGVVATALVDDVPD